mmetsp:Transcript_3533/g.6768  ORF Transcript_3533/g.6768 Transcript_3533/m.6768 type:complete len:84 (+) Transcript_3533:1222-1473(+)
MTVSSQGQDTRFVPMTLKHSLYCMHSCTQLSGIVTCSMGQIFTGGVYECAQCGTTGTISKVSKPHLLSVFWFFSFKGAFLRIT